MNRIVRVGIDTPFIEPVNEFPISKQRAIKAAMAIAIEWSNPGDVIAQDDMVFHTDPFDTPLERGVITMLQPKTSTDPKHWCPQAFRYATVEDGELIIRAWASSRKKQACVCWWKIPKRLTDCATHSRTAVAVNG